MNKEELYKLALSDVHRYSLLNEIFAIRDERFPNEQRDSMLCVNGYIGLDVLNDYVDLQQRIDKAIEYIKPRFMNRIDNDKRYFENYDIQQIYEILKGDDDE